MYLYLATAHFLVWGQSAQGEKAQQLHKHPLYWLPLPPLSCYVSARTHTNAANSEPDSFASLAVLGVDGVLAVARAVRQQVVRLEGNTFVRAFLDALDLGTLFGTGKP